MDFYASEHHASNVGRIFRPDADPLTPNWKHLPIGYHGRAGTVVVSGTPVVRPNGQRKGPSDAEPTFGPVARLDIEAEVGFVVGVPSTLGTPVPIDDFAEHVFGVVLVNDWSARDIQAWEYVPLGPFLGKSFATSISPWVVPLAALEHARVAAAGAGPDARCRTCAPTSRGVWTSTLSSSGTAPSCPGRRSGRCTGPRRSSSRISPSTARRCVRVICSRRARSPVRRADQRGSLLELTWNGTSPTTLVGGTPRTFLEDGDTVTISGTAPGANGIRIGLGEVTGVIRAASG